MSFAIFTLYIRVIFFLYKLIAFFKKEEYSYLSIEVRWYILYFYTLNLQGCFHSSYRLCIEVYAVFVFKFVGFLFSLFCQKSHEILLILADQSTLFKLARADYPHLLLLASPMFFTFRHHCTYVLT